MSAESLVGLDVLVCVSIQRCINLFVSKKNFTTDTFYVGILTTKVRPFFSFFKKRQHAHKNHIPLKKKQKKKLFVPHTR